MGKSKKKNKNKNKNKSNVQNNTANINNKEKNKVVKEQIKNEKTSFEEKTVLKVEAKKVETAKTPERKVETISSEDNKKIKKNLDFKFAKGITKKLSALDGGKKAFVFSSVAISLLFVVLAILLLCGVFASDENKVANVVYYGRNESESVVSEIASDEEEQKQMVKGTKASGCTGRFDFYSLTQVNISDPGSLVPISISNPTYNECTIIVTITDGNGKILYRSLGIEPGKFINAISFNTGLNYGENNLKMYVTAFEGDGGKNGRSFKKIGNQFIDLKVSVGTEYNSSMMEELKPSQKETVTVAETTTQKSN